MGRAGPESIPDPPKAVTWIVRTLESAGHEGWAVGGGVRDALLGMAGTDWDLATSARPGEVRRIFRRTVPIGLEFGTVGVLARDGVLYDVTTFRRDVETDGRRAVVAFADRVEDDLARRDFTINAVAWHPLRHEFVDPFGGREDLRSGVLRTVGDASLRFAEDHLRILRALRFAGRYSLRVEPSTWEALVRDRASVRRLSPERVREELLKVLSTPRPSAALGLYAASGVLEVLFPELQRVVERSDSGEDGWARSLLVADVLPPNRPLLRLAALLQDLGAVLDGAGEPRRRGVEAALGLLARLRFSNAQQSEVAAWVDAVAFPPSGVGKGGQGRGALLRRWASRVGRPAFPGVARIWAAGARVDRRFRGDDTSGVPALIRELRAVYRSGAALSVDELALDGNDLMRMGLRPGPAFGRILRHLLDVVLEDPSLNQGDRLIQEVQRWLAVSAEGSGSSGGGDGDG